MAVPVTFSSGESCHQHVRAKSPNHPHHVSQSDIVTLPFLKSFLRALREAKIRYASKTLLDPVVAIRGSQLQSAQDAQHVEQITADFVLSTFATIQGQQYTLAPLPRDSSVNMPPSSSSGCAVVCIRRAVVCSRSSICFSPRAPVS